MEERKLIRLGNSSFAIALPKNWVTRSNLRKGDKVFLVHNSNGEIIVSSEFKSPEEKKVEIDLKDRDEEFIKKSLHAAYTRGYNNIILKALPKEHKVIKKLLKDYLSLEIIDSNDKETIIKDFFDLREVKFENFVRRMDNNLREMFDILLEHCKMQKLKPKVLEEVNEIDKAVNKFYFLCSRIFLKGIDNPTILNNLKLDGGKLFSNWWVAFHLESLGDGLKYAVKWITKLNPKKRDALCSILSRLQEEHIKCMNAFYKEEKEKSFEVIQDTKKIKEEIEKLEREDLEISKITQALDIIERNIYQNAKMISYMKF